MLFVQTKILLTLYPSSSIPYLLWPSFFLLYTTCFIFLSRSLFCIASSQLTIQPSWTCPQQHKSKFLNMFGTIKSISWTCPQQPKFKHRDTAEIPMVGFYCVPLSLVLQRGERVGFPFGSHLAAVFHLAAIFLPP